MRKRFRPGAASGLVLVLTVIGAAQSASAQMATASYPNMAPLDQYTMDRDAEIAMAKSAAVPAISDDATILVLGAHGYETAMKGTNQFTCMVERSWDKPYGDPEFWNPKMRGPNCMNEAAARSVLPMVLERTEWVLAGVSESEMAERAKTSAKANTPPAPGSMTFMLSKQQYLNDGAHPAWHPHVMFYTPTVDGSAWGADVKDSPVQSAPLTDQVYNFFIPVRKWSDGTLAEYASPPTAASTMAGSTTAASTEEHHH
jgi:hypothetical protein